MDNKFKFDQRSINPPYQTFPQVGSYFMLMIPTHRVSDGQSYFVLSSDTPQPAWCSYSLHELKSAWDKVGGIIINSDGVILYCKEPIPFVSNTFC